MNYILRRITNLGIGLKVGGRTLYLVVLLLFVGIASWGQSRKKEITPSIGFVVSHEEFVLSDQETAFGIHIGANLYSKELKPLKSDLQLSLNLTGMPMGTGRILSVNALYGGRYYIINPEKNVSVFINGLVGGAFIAESGDDYTENRFGLGYSAGVFGDINRFILGISVESFNSFILKAGYSF
jgi:hypothetical protein